MPSTRNKVVGTFHVPSTRNPGKSSTANGTAERADCDGSPRIRLKRYRWVYPSGTIINGYR